MVKFLLCFSTFPSPFEAEISYIPVEDHHSVVHNKEKCFSRYVDWLPGDIDHFVYKFRVVVAMGRCPKCLNYDSALESPGVVNEKGASVMATYSSVDSESLLDLACWLVR